MIKNFSLSKDGDRRRNRADTPGPAATVLRMPVDLHSVSLAVLTVLAVVFVMAWPILLAELLKKR